MGVETNPREEQRMSTAFQLSLHLIDWHNQLSFRDTFKECKLLTQLSVDSFSSARLEQIGVERLGSGEVAHTGLGIKLLSLLLSPFKSLAAKTPASNWVHQNFRMWSKDRKLDTRALEMAGSPSSDLRKYQAGEAQLAAAVYRRESQGPCDIMK